jgi:hypothetical protein
MDDAYKWGRRNGIAYESAYIDRDCKFNATNTNSVKIVDYRYLLPGDELALQYAVATIGPIIIAIDASQPSFQLYKGGIYDEPTCSNEADHAGEFRSFKYFI